MHRLTVAADGSAVAQVADVIQGKHLVRSAVTHEFIHNSFAHRETRVLKHLPDALADAGPW